MPLPSMILLTKSITPMVSLFDQVDHVTEYLNASLITNEPMFFMLFCIIESNSSYCVSLVYLNSCNISDRVASLIMVWSMKTSSWSRDVLLDQRREYSLSGK